jgi:hypothetical protein
LKLQQYSIAGRWLDLAELALHSRPKLIAKARADIELGTLLRAEIIKQFHHLMKTRVDWLESFLEKDDYSSIDNVTAVIESLKRVKDKPESLEEEMRSLPELVYVMWGNYTLSDDAFPRRYSAEIDQKYAQHGCEFHSINSSIMVNIAMHLHSSDLSSLRRTCRFFEHLTHHPDIFKGIHIRNDWSLVPRIWWGEPSRPWRWITSFRVTHFFIEFLKVLRECALLRKTTDPAYYAQRRSILEKFYSANRLLVSTDESNSTRAGWMAFSSMIVRSPSRNEAQALTSTGVFWDALVYCLMDTTIPKYMDELPGMITVYITAMLRGEAPRFINFSPLFYPLLSGTLHNDVSAALAVHHGYQRLVEMDFQIICDLKDTIQQQPLRSVAHRFDMNGVWQGVMHYASPTLEDSYSEEMIMNLKFPQPLLSEAGYNGALPFELIEKTGLDSIGEFEIENATIDPMLFTVSFTKVYRGVIAGGGELKHKYNGILHSYGMGGHFGTVPRPGAENNLQIGYWFIGRPMAYSPGSLAAGDILDETKIGPWDHLVATIKTKAASNEALKKTWISESGVRASYFEENPNLLIHQLPFMTDGDRAILNLRLALKYRALARTASTTLGTLRNNVQIASRDLEGLELNYMEPDFVPFENDNEEKAALRMQLFNISNTITSLSMNLILAEYSHLLPLFVETLERHDCDVSEEEVKGVIFALSRLLCRVPNSVSMSIRGLLQAFKAAIADQSNRAREQPQGNEHAAADPNAVVPSSISRFMKRAQHHNNDSSDSDSEDDSTKFTRKRKPRGLSNSTLLIAGSLTLASMVAAAFYLGRFTQKRRKD